MKTFMAAIMVLALLGGSYAYGEEYSEFAIKYGMHEKIVNEMYGEPISSVYIKKNPIPKKKALYEIGETDYMILHYFSGRIYKITLLEDMMAADAIAIFDEN